MYRIALLLAAPFAAGPAPAADPPPADREKGADASLAALWEELKGEDAARAYQAIRGLAAVPEKAVPFLAARLLPPPAAGDGRMPRLLDDLNANSFRTRERATRELEKMAMLALPALRQRL